MFLEVPDIKKEVSKRKECNKCSLRKKINFVSKSNLIRKKGNGKDFLFITEMVEPKENIEKFERYLQGKGFKDYTILSAIYCQSKRFEIPNPVKAVYNTCNVQINLSDYGVVFPIGRAINYLTKSSDLISYKEFWEVKFNPTFFYNDFSQKEKVRCYPLPPFFEFLGLDNYCSYFANLQLMDGKKNLYKRKKLADYEIIESDNPNELLKKLSPIKGEIVLDLETNDLDVFSETFKIGVLVFTFDGKTGYFLDWSKVDIRVFTMFIRNKTIIGANIKYDIKALVNSGVPLKFLKVSGDTQLLSHILNTERTKNGLKSLAWLIGFGGYDKPLDDYKNLHKIKNYLDIPLPIMKDYAVLDVIVAYKLNEYFKELIKKQPDSIKIYEDVIKSYPVFLEMELNGMKIDVDYMNNLRKEKQKELQEIEKQIFEINNGVEFKISSPKQVGAVLEKLNIPCIEKTKSGDYATGSEVLRKLSKQGYKIFKLLSKHRELSKLLSTYVGEYTVFEDNHGFMYSPDEIESLDNNEESFSKYIKKDGKIHGNFMVGMADSLRTRSNNPNLQNITKSEEIRKIIKPEGVFVEIDFSGFQMRIATIYSQDEGLEYVFNKGGGDAHSVTARNVFMRDKTLEEFLELKKQGNEFANKKRQLSKGINFSFLFGASHYSFRELIELEWDEKEVDEYIRNEKLPIKKDREGKLDKILTVAFDIRKKFFEGYPKLEVWYKSFRSFALNNGYIDSWFGGRRHLPELFYVGKDFDKKRLSNLNNIVVNSPTQNFEAIWMLRSITNIYNRIKEKGLKVNFVGMVHDSMVLDVLDKKDLIEVYRLKKECMEDYNNFIVPITTDFAVGEVWGYGKEIKNEKELEVYIE